VSDNENNLDPEIAELLGIEAEEEVKEEGKPDFFPESGKPISKTEIRQIDPHAVLNDKKSYSRLISAGGEHGKRLHEIISKFMQASQKDEKGMYREKIVPAYWNMVHAMVDNFFDDLTSEKQALFRYGLLNSSFIDEKQRGILSTIDESVSAENLYYFDEWLLKVGNGDIKPSSVDETAKAKKKTPSSLRSKMERKIGARDAELSTMKLKTEQHLMIEKSLKSSISIITNHDHVGDYGDVIAPYSVEQKKALVQIQDIVKNLLKSDREMSAAYSTVKSLDREIDGLKAEGGDTPVEVDTKTVKEEFSTVKQMVKMTVGRQGNHFPFLIKTYMPSSEREICTKSRLKSMLEEIEGLDTGIFLRTYKREEHRILPLFVIVPSYGDTGICWEPFDRMNKATGKGRISIPLYPRNLKVAVLSALGDLRWQIAKEKALHYWMEEGLTGHYYQYAQEKKVKGDLKDLFIQDYILWITFESQGMQKLQREVRSIFWRYIPFPQAVKENLKNRGYYYAELYKKDQNRAVSRGY